MKFKEYLNSNGKLQDKPIIDPKADTAPKPTKSPPDPKKGETLGDYTGKPAAYTPPGTEKGAQKYEKGGLVNQGDKKLVYNPTTKENPSPSKWDTKTTWPKVTKSEEFIDATRDMSLPKFTKFMIDSVKPDDNCPTIFANKEGPFRPNPYEAVRYVAHLAINNEAVMESLVMEFIRKEGLPTMMNELFKHGQSYKEAVSAMNVDRFINTIREETSDPVNTEVDKDEKKPTNSGRIDALGKAAKPRVAGSIAKEQPMDMAGSGVGSTRTMKKK